MRRWSCKSRYSAWRYEPLDRYLKTGVIRGTRSSSISELWSTRYTSQPRDECRSIFSSVFEAEERTRCLLGRREVIHRVEETRGKARRRNGVVFSSSIRTFRRTSSIRTASRHRSQRRESAERNESSNRNDILESRTSRDAINPRYRFHHVEQRSSSRCCSSETEYTRTNGTEIFSLELTSLARA